MKNLIAFSVAFLTTWLGHAAVTVEHVGLVAPDILEVIVRAGEVRIGTQQPYRKQTGDVIQEGGRNHYLVRNGKELGVLVGHDRDILCPFDVFTDDLLETENLGEQNSYRITSASDPNYQADQHPVAVCRKHKPIGVARTDDWKFKAPVQYHLYLKLPHSLQENASYTVAFNGLPIPDQTFDYKPMELRSEAIHVSQIGFCPNDPVKRAFLSCWLGDGGGVVYPSDLQFHLIKASNRTRVYSGLCRLTKPKKATDEDAYHRNFTLANVYEMDFSAVREQGLYQVYVEGIGCSYPFRISPQVWKEAFITSARGFYHQRSGIDLGPPFTSFRRPRSFHPADGVKVYASSTRLMDTRNGLSRSDPNNFRNLVAGKTDELVTNAWGGYMDAGDWDRRIQHLIASLYLLDLGAMFPDFTTSVSLNIPESTNALPDVVDEALFNLDCYRRLQTPAGGIRGGIESAEHPNLGETSWQESLTVMAYAPGSWSSYYYAGVAAKAAGVLKALGKPGLAAIYQTSALRAMEWAEQDYAQRQSRPATYETGGVKIERMDNHIDVRNKRNYAAAELFRLTGDERWHRVFLETTISQ